MWRNFDKPGVSSYTAMISRQPIMKLTSPKKERVASATLFTFSFRAPALRGSVDNPPAFVLEMPPSIISYNVSFRANPSGHRLRGDRPPANDRADVLRQTTRSCSHLHPRANEELPLNLHVFVFVTVGGSRSTHTVAGSCDGTTDGAEAHNQAAGDRGCSSVLLVEFLLYYQRCTLLFIYVRDQIISLRDFNNKN